MTSDFETQALEKSPGAMFTEHLKKKDFATSYFF